MQEKAVRSSTTRKVDTYGETSIHRATRLIGLAPFILLQFLLELFGLPVPDLDRADVVICLLKLNRSITHILAYQNKNEPFSREVSKQNTTYHPFPSKLSGSPLGQRKRQSRISPKDRVSGRNDSHEWI